MRIDWLFIFFAFRILEVTILAAIEARIRLSALDRESVFPLNATTSDWSFRLGCRLRILHGSLWNRSLLSFGFTSTKAKSSRSDKRPAHRASHFPDRLNIESVWQFFRVLISPLWMLPFIEYRESVRGGIVQCKEALVSQYGMPWPRLVFNSMNRIPHQVWGAYADHRLSVSSMFSADEQTCHSIPYRWSTSSSEWSVSNHP